MKCKRKASSLLSRLESQSQESGLTRRLVIFVPKDLELLARGAWHKCTGASSSVYTRAAHADAERFWRLLAIRSTHTSFYFLQLLLLRSRFARPQRARRRRVSND